MTDLERGHDKGHNVVTELPEIQCPSCSLYVPHISLTSVQVTRRSFRPPANLLPPQPSQTSISSSRLVHLKPSMMDDTHPTLHSPQLHPPVQIVHPIFNLFVQLVDDPSAQPTNKDLKLTEELMHLLSIIDTSELKRNAEIRTKLTAILGLDVHDEPNTDKSSADGVHMFIVNGMRLPLLILDVKQELCDGCDPSTQASFTMRRFMDSR